jgi:hypothetical protein
MMHGWAKQMAGWWNRMVARHAGDMDTRKQNKTMAAFRLGTRELGVNAMRFGPNKVERKQRVCKC